VNLNKDVDHGARAERLLKDEMLAKAFTDVEAAIIERWKSCPLKDRDSAHEYRLMYKLLSDVRANLELAVADGKIAAAELKRQDERRPFLRRVLGA
jgi:hypothetical protein